MEYKHEAMVQLLVKYGAEPTPTAGSPSSFGVHISPRKRQHYTELRSQTFDRIGATAARTNYIQHRPRLTKCAVQMLRKAHALHEIAYSALLTKNVTTCYNVFLQYLKNNEESVLSTTEDIKEAPNELQLRIVSVVSGNAAVNALNKSKNLNCTYSQQKGTAT